MCEENKDEEGARGVRLKMRNGRGEKTVIKGNISIVNDGRVIKKEDNDGGREYSEKGGK